MKKILQFILLIITLLAAVGLILTTLAGALRPSQNIWLHLFAFGYPFLLAANIILMLVWLSLGQWQFLINVASIALRWGFVGLYFQIGGTSAVPNTDCDRQTVTLMTYNVHMFKGDGVNSTPSDSNATEFLGLLRHVGTPDILCLQEYARPKTLAVTDSLVLMGYNHYYGVNISNKGVPYGTVIFSKMPISYVNRIDSEKLFVDIIHPCGTKFRVCNIHMDSYRFDDNDKQEIERLRHGDLDTDARQTFSKIKTTILNHEKEWEQHLKPVVTECSLPLIVAGDLNDIPSSWLYKQFSNSLTDTYCEEGTGFSTTYNGGFPNYRIDMVFHSGELRTSSYKRIKNRLSDHYPVLTSFELPQ